MRATRMAGVVLPIAMIAAFFCPEVRAQQENDVAAMTGQIEKFFENLAEPTYPPSFVFSEFIAGSPLEPQVNDIKKLVEQYGGLQEKYGKFLEAERVDVKTVGKDLVTLRFLYKMERYPVVWYFTYYRAPLTENASWKLVSLKFDTRLHLLGE